MRQLNKPQDESVFQNVRIHNGKVLFKKNGSSGTKLFYG